MGEEAHGVVEVMRHGVGTVQNRGAFDLMVRNGEDGQREVSIGGWWFSLVVVQGAGFFCSRGGEEDERKGKEETVR